jgi:predicted negative regulator of RcsB-dependent stress response
LADIETVRGWLALESGDIAAARAHFDKALEMTAAEQVPFRAEPLAELCRGWLEEGR